jgi:hypothetical protein
MFWHIDYMDGGWGCFLMMILLVITTVGRMYYGWHRGLGLGSINDDIRTDGWTSETRARHLAEKAAKEKKRRALNAVKPDPKFTDRKLDDLIEYRRYAEAEQYINQMLKIADEVGNVQATANYTAYRGRMADSAAQRMKAQHAPKPAPAHNPVPMHKPDVDMEFMSD